MSFNESNFITLENILPFNEYNKCELCHRKTNLNECNSCCELYCIKCDKLENTSCRYCIVIFEKLRKLEKEKHRNLKPLEDFFERCEAYKKSCQK